MNFYEITSPIISLWTVIYYILFLLLVWYGTTLLFERYNFKNAFRWAVGILFIVILTISPKEMEYYKYNKKELAKVLIDLKGSKTDDDDMNYYSYDKDELIEKLRLNRPYERYALKILDRELSKSEREKEELNALLDFLAILLPLFIILGFFGDAVKEDTYEWADKNGRQSVYENMKSRLVEKEKEIEALKNKIDKDK